MSSIFRKRIWVILATFLVAGCSNTEVDIKQAAPINMTDTDNKQAQMETTLKISGKLTLGEAISFGNTYMLSVDKVISGKLEEEDIRILVMVEDKKETYIKNHLSPSVVEITFVKKEENVPYQLMPITGFVDKQMTSWEIINIQ